jgi:hypothetical protein
MSKAETILEDVLQRIEDKLQGFVDDDALETPSFRDFCDFVDSVNRLLDEDEKIQIPSGDHDDGG